MYKIGCQFDYTEVHVFIIEEYLNIGTVKYWLLYLNRFISVRPKFATLRHTECVTEHIYYMSKLIQFDERQL